MNILPKIRTRFGEQIGAEMYVTPPDLSGNNWTNIAADAASGVSSFTVDNGLKFAVDQYVLIGAWGGAKSEIIKIHASSGPTATTITLATATSFAHNRGERITFIPYNQVVLEKSTDNGANYASLVTLGIRADSTETYYNDVSGLSTYYYRVKFSNSTSANTSSVSDGIIATGFAENSVGTVIRDAMSSMGEEFDDVITKEFMYSALHEGRVELDQAPGIKRWSFRRSYDYIAGPVIAGQNTVALPATLRDPSTYKNIISVRAGRSKLPISYEDKTKLNVWYQGVSRSTLNGAITTGSVTMVLASSGDFDEGGTVSIAGESVSDVIDTVTYTANDETTKTLSGVTGIQAAGHSSGAVVWQGASFGYPIGYTVDGTNIIFSQPFDDELAGENVTMDFYTKLVRADSDGDTLDEPNPSMFIPYLRWRMKKRRNKDLKRDEDDDYKDWTEKKSELVSNEYLGQDMRISIDLPC